MCLIIVLIALPAGLAACGDDDDGDSAGPGRQGGSITIGQNAQPDYLDPALSYNIAGWEPMWLVYTPPVAYKHAEGKDGTELIPGLAEHLPQVSDDGKTVSFRFREGLKYSDGTPLKASDFEHTIKRVLNLESGVTGFYLVIDGAQQYVEAGRPEADISGIETDNRTRDVTVHLTHRDGTILNLLAMNFAGVVPGDTPFRNLSAEPPPGIGPYKITESVPNRRFVMERNRRFDIPGIPKGHLDRITTRIVPSLNREATMVIRGDLDYMVEAPPADLLPTIRTKYGDRYEEHPSATTEYFWMNESVPPFDRKAVRQAVSYAVDSGALARLFGGRLEPSCNFLPSSLSGYEPIDPCPYGDPAGPGDPDKAAQLIKQAGAEGAEVTVWTNDVGVALPAGEYLADLLNKIGLDAKLKTISAAVFFQVVGNQRTRAQIGFANWQEDFPHPADFLFLVDGESIQPTNNPNIGNVDDPELNRLIDQVKRLPANQAADAAADADRRIADEAHVTAYGTERLPTFFSERMDSKNCSLFHPVYSNDYSSFCLK